MEQLLKFVAISSYHGSVVNSIALFSATTHFCFSVTISATASPYSQPVRLMKPNNAIPHTLNSTSRITLEQLVPSHALNSTNQVTQDQLVPPHTLNSSSRITLGQLVPSHTLNPTIELLRYTQYRKTSKLKQLRCPTPLFLPKPAHGPK